MITTQGITQRNVILDYTVTPDFVYTIDVNNQQVISVE